MRKNASPGPDGLNAAFYRSAWSWIKDDLMTLVQDFYQTGNIPPELNKPILFSFLKRTDLFPLKTSGLSVFAMFPTRF